jgi:NUMOD3 motif-containing protein
MLLTTPYIYYLRWSKLGKQYLGCRFRRGCHPSDLWVSYFSSSKVVQKIRREYGSPDIIKIVRVFNAKEGALSKEEQSTIVETEHRYLSLFQAMQNEKWLNLCNGGSAQPPEFRHSDDTRQRMSAPHKKIPNGCLGKKRSEETKAKLRAARLQQKDPRLGKKHSEEAKRKMSETHKKVWEKTPEDKKEIWLEKTIKGPNAYRGGPGKKSDRKKAPQS